MEPDQQMPPVPPSPPSPGAPAPAELSQEQMKTNLQEMMAKIESKMGDFNAHKFASTNKIKEHQGQALREIFSLLESMGVDPSNPEEVRAFLDDMKLTNPELAKQIESAMALVLGEDEEVTEETPPVNMNTNLDEAPPEAV